MSLGNPIFSSQTPLSGVPSACPTIFVQNWVKSRNLSVLLKTRSCFAVNIGEFKRKMRQCWKLIISTFTSPAHQFCRWSIPYIACPAVYQSIEVTLSNTKSIQMWDFLDQLQYFEGTFWLVLHCQLFRYGRRKTNNRFTYLFISFTNQCLWIHGKVPWPKSHAIVHISIFQKEKTLQPENKQKWRQNWGILKLRRLCCQVGGISFIWPQEHVASCCYERSLLEGYIAKRNPFCESNRSRIDACASQKNHGSVVALLPGICL